MSSIQPYNKRPTAGNICPKCETTATYKYEYIRPQVIHFGWTTLEVTEKMIHTCNTCGYTTATRCADYVEVPDAAGE